MNHLRMKTNAETVNWDETCQLAVNMHEVITLAVNMPETITLAVNVHEIIALAVNSSFFEQGASRALRTATACAPRAQRAL